MSSGTVAVFVVADVDGVVVEETAGFCVLFSIAAAATPPPIATIPMRMITNSATFRRLLRCGLMTFAVMVAGAWSSCAGVGVFAFASLLATVVLAVTSGAGSGVDEDATDTGVECVEASVCADGVTGAVAPEAATKTSGAADSIPGVLASAVEAATSGVEETTVTGIDSASVDTLLVSSGVAGASSTAAGVGTLSAGESTESTAGDDTLSLEATATSFASALIATFVGGVLVSVSAGTSGCFENCIFGT